jgi:hypothetical protein
MFAGVGSLAVASGGASFQPLCAGEKTESCFGRAEIRGGTRNRGGSGVEKGMVEKNRKFAEKGNEVSPKT